MIKEVIGVGETELDALNDAKRQLGLDETDEVEFELIQRAEKKKFGLFGGAPAKVKVTLKATPEDKAEEFLRNVLDKMNLQSVVIEKNFIEEAWLMYFNRHLFENGVISAKEYKCMVDKISSITKKHRLGI